MILKVVMKVKALRYAIRFILGFSLKLIIASLIAKHFKLVNVYQNYNKLLKTIMKEK